MASRPQPEPVPTPPRQGDIWWSAAPPVQPSDVNQSKFAVGGISEEQLQDWLSCTAGWKALELSWGALQSCEVRPLQLKPLLQAAMAEAARLGAERLVVRQLDVDEVVGRCLALALSGFPNFTALKLREMNLYDEAIGHLCGALHSAEHLRRLVLDTVWASLGGWSALAAAIKVNTSLQSIRMRYCLNGPALPALCSVLADQHGQLESLLLSYNTLGDTGVEELCKALSRSCTQATSRPSRVAHLDLSHNDAGKQCIPAVAIMLRTVRTLRHIDMSYNELGAEGARELCRALSYSPHLTSLRMAATGADDSAVEALTWSLYGTTTTSMSGALTGLVTLCLAHNRVSHKGAAMLAATTRRPGCALADVDLAGNGQVGEAGAKAWAEVLTSPSAGSRLRRLVLSGCEVPDEGAYALGAALKSNTGLLELGLAENHISTSGLALLAEVIKSNSTLRLLDVSLNMVGPQGMIPFSQASHLRGHVFFSKSRDHTVKRISSCVVKAELLREYRVVEAVKNSSEPWERNADVSVANPFGSPAGAGGAAQPAAAADTNPFLSPTTSYINPFLDPMASGAPNPFLDPGDPDFNPFRSPPPTVKVVDNPFLSPPDAASVGSEDGRDPSAAAGAASADGRELATRVLTRLGTRDTSSEDGRGGGGGSADDGSADDGSADDGSADDGSGTGVYVSSRSTADECDLVTELDLRLVDYMLESLGMTQAPGGEAALPRPQPDGDTAPDKAYEAEQQDWGPAVAGAFADLTSGTGGLGAATHADGGVAPIAFDAAGHDGGSAGAGAVGWGAAMTPLYGGSGCGGDTDRGAGGSGEEVRVEYPGRWQRQTDAEAVRYVPPPLDPFFGSEEPEASARAPPAAEDQNPFLM